MGARGIHPDGHLAQPPVPAQVRGINQCPDDVNIVWYLFLWKVPFFGIYVVMFIDVSYTFMKVSVVVLLFIFAFSLGFFVLLSNQQYFSNLMFAIIKTLIMTSGEMEYDNLFFDNQHNYENLITVPYMNTTKALFVLFVITMPIIIMNLLVGLAVDDIKLVQENAVLKRIAMQVGNKLFLCLSNHF